MPTDVLMPQMGESIAEGTIVRWIKSVGEPVDRDEPLFEISTDKVDAEVPAPAGGVLVQIRAEAGETVPVNSVVAVIGAAGEVVAAGEEAAARAGASPPVPTEASRVEAPGPAADAPAPAAHGGRLSPVVRRLAAEHDVDLSAVTGTGEGGRISKADVLAHVEARGQGGSTGADAAPPAPPGTAGRRVEPMSVMRRRIAEHWSRAGEPRPTSIPCSRSTSRPSRRPGPGTPRGPPRAISRTSPGRCRKPSPRRRWSTRRSTAGT